MHFAVKSVIAYKELQRKSKKPLFSFLVDLAEQLIEKGDSQAEIFFWDEDQDVSNL